MSYQYSRPTLGHSSSTPSPLRHASNASSDSSAHTTSTRPFLSGTTSAASSAELNGYRLSAATHKRGYSETVQASQSPTDNGRIRQTSPSISYKAMRQSLRPLAQAPAASPPSQYPRSPTGHGRSHSVDAVELKPNGTTSPVFQARHSLALCRADSIRAPATGRAQMQGAHHAHPIQSTSFLEKPDLQSLQRSSTTHLRTLSRFAEDGADEDFAINSPEQEVVGMHGRRRLQRTMSKRGKQAPATTSWGGRTWMDQQRQFLQAYEYLCHIGEAKEWIEDIINKPVPPIVELEEALRDGVTLAEIVQALYPERQLRIFRHPKLQFRHSDNIALFFRFLAEVDLPELFRFELVDLYEKKNIPKVIYCIHALSWLLFRKGVVQFRIGNLVGQLQFEHHELEAMQKGLDKAGISMPNFSGMSASFGEMEPEPEPPETEQDRIDRELGERELIIVDLQAQIRGALVRMRLGDMMQHLWDMEHLIVDMQSRIRGDWARQILQYRLEMKRFAVNLQSAARGFLIRSRERSAELYWRDKSHQVVALQSLVRAWKARTEVSFTQSRMQHHESGIREFQAAIRGATKRWQVGEQYYQTRQAESGVKGLQSSIRGMLERRALRSDRNVLTRCEPSLRTVQAAARAYILRQQNKEVHTTLEINAGTISVLQSLFRGNLVRTSQAELCQKLAFQKDSIRGLQAVARGLRVRSEIATTRLSLSQHHQSVLNLQSLSRGFVYRTKTRSLLQALQQCSQGVTFLQSLTRGFLSRHRVAELLSQVHQHQSGIAELQSICRAAILRGEIGATLARLEETEPSIIELQANIRGNTVRRRFEEKQKFFKENMAKVVKIQSFVRGKQQGEAYKTLTNGKNPPVGTIKNFVHLLNDSDFDFDEEIEFERLRKTVVQQVRQNEMAEQYIDQLDIKIALLVKNKITLDEVVKHQRHYGGHVGSLLNNKELSSKDPFDLKALNKNSRRKLEQYQELFFILQTQPQYLARLFKRVREQGTAEKECKRIEQLVMGLFGFAQKRREEYYLLKLMARAMKEEMDGCLSLQDYLRGNFFWCKVLNYYVRSPRDRKFLRDLLGPLIKENIIENEGLDLESDPIQIYRSAINNEELRTGQRSRRRPDIPREEAIRDPETRETFIRHLQDLRDIADQFFGCFEELLLKMPYGIRFIAQQTFNVLCEKFPYEDQRYLLQVVGQWTWKTYFQTALTQPETCGVADRGLSPIQKRNLGEVAKVLGQISLGRLFGGDNVYLQPLNSYVTEAIGRIEEIWTNMIQVRDAEAQFDIDEFNDLYARTKPTLYIKLGDIFAIHQLIASDISQLCPANDDILREVIRELGSAKNNENEMSGVSSAEISLTLNPKLHDVEDPDAAVKALFMETKRYILYIIRVQSGANLMEIMVRPITPEDEDRWEALLRDELAQNPDLRKGAYSETTTLVDITSMGYAELKRTALENLIQLERAGRVSRHNQYQDLLNAIAVDIRTKHRRRVQRARELEGVRATLAALDEKAAWLDQQLKSYNDYIEQAMVTLQTKKGKKRFLLPFTKQYNHERELARSGRVPKFGSFKYSARTLADKGVLVSWAGYPEHRWDKVNLTISSDEVGVFHIEGSSGSMMIPGASASVPLDDLLQAQFNNCQFMNLFGTGPSQSEGVLRLNVNLFLHLVFKKFYRDE